ncbi:MAG: zinc-ribbon domain-containing protein [Planctomycetota bacterium]
MPGDQPHYDDDLELDPEGPSPEDLERFDRDGSDCPSCGAEVYDDATVCPICGELLTAEPGSGPSKLTIAVVGLVIAAFVLVFIF